MTTLEQALDYMRDPQYSQPETYREMCEAIIANSDQLAYAVYIYLPGGLTGNDDPAWDAVRDGSRSLCGCGNERVIEPQNMRNVFEPSDVEPIVMGMGDKVYIRPIGAPAMSAYVMFEVIEQPDGRAAWTFLNDPMKPVSVNALLDLFGGPKGYVLDQLESVLANEPDVAPFVKGSDNGQIPVCGLQSADAAAKTVTLVLDAAVEVFDPDKEPAHAH